MLLGCPATHSLIVPTGEVALPPGVTQGGERYTFQTESAYVSLNGSSYSRGGPPWITLDLMISNISEGDVLVSIDRGDVRMTGCVGSEVETSAGMFGQGDNGGGVIASGGRSLVTVTSNSPGTASPRVEGEGSRS